MKIRTLFFFVVIWAGLLQSVQAADPALSVRQALDEMGLEDAVLMMNVRIHVESIRPEHSPVDLWATVILPDDSGVFPTILTATPYRRDLLGLASLGFVQYGYAVVIVDIRGTGSSHGQWQSFDLEEQYDIAYVIDRWIPAQPWSDGTVGMYGAPYMGIIQLLSAGQVETDASGEPVHLKALFAQVPMSDAYGDIVMHGGTPDMGFIPMWLLGSDLMAILEPVIAEGNSGEAWTIWMKHLRQIPVHIGWLMDADHAVKCGFYDRKSPMIYWPEKPGGGWGFADGERVIPRKLPVFMTGAWFDIFTRGTLNYYEYGLSRHKDEDRSMLVCEGYHMDGAAGGLEALCSFEFQARWFDWKMKGNDDFFLAEFPVILEVMGMNRYRAEKSWPLPEERLEKCFLHLSKKRPSVIEGDWFSNRNRSLNYSLVSNPAISDYVGTNGENIEDPVLYHMPPFFHGKKSRSAVRWSGGNMKGESLEGEEDERSDELGVVTFTTEPLDEDLEIAGPMLFTFRAKTRFTRPDSMQDILDWQNEFVEAVLFGGNDNMLLDLMNEQDVQFVVELNDVFPDGSARNITSGWTRASHRPYDQYDPVRIDRDYTPFDPFYDHPHEHPLPIEEDTAYEYAVEIWPTCNVFREGHRIRLSVSASDTPHLLALMTPSRNTLIIDGQGVSGLEFTRVNEKGEGELWKWIDDPNHYLLEATDRKDDASGEESGHDSIYVPADDDDDCFIASVSAR